MQSQKAKILAKFQKYKFVDEYGHPLENCKDFLDLVDRAYPEHYPLRVNTWGGNITPSPTCPKPPAPKPPPKAP